MLLSVSKPQGNEVIQCRAVWETGCRQELPPWLLLCSWTSSHKAQAKGLLHSLWPPHWQPPLTWAGKYYCACSLSRPSYSWMLKLTMILWDLEKLEKKLQDNKKGYLKSGALLVTLTASKHAAVTGNTLQNMSIINLCYSSDFKLTVAISVPCFWIKQWK